jgi:hypothetical protein
MFLQRELRWRLEHTRSGTHSIWISEQLQEPGHEVIVANVRKLRAIPQLAQCSGLTLRRAQHPQQEPGERLRLVSSSM